MYTNIISYLSLFIAIEDNDQTCVQMKTHAHCKIWFHANNKNNNKAKKKIK